MGNLPLRLLACLLLTLPSAASVHSSVATADTVSALELVSLHNELRVASGAPAIKADPRVVLAAQRHADYLALNATGGHQETPGIPGFSGPTARERVAAAGWTTAFVSEVAASYSGARNALAELWQAPYHRLGMMHPSAVATGWGHSDLGGRSATVGDLVYDFAARPVEFVRSPAHLQQGIPPSWSGQESPSPLPSGVSGPVGYPIMVVYSGGQSAQMRAAEIIAPGGTPVPFYYAPQIYESDYQAIIPRQPLASGAAYHVRMDLTVGGRMVTNEWDFTTAGAAAATAPPPVQPIAPAALQTFGSSFLDQTPWPTLQPGAATSVVLRFRNTGTIAWTRGVAGRQANLGINGDSKTFAGLGMAMGWLSADRVATTTEPTVAPGAVGTFAFTIRAPLAAGEYRLPLRPVIDGVQWMQDQGVFLVVKSGWPGYHAKWVSQSPYPTLRAGEVSPPLTITFMNTGTAPWVRGLAGQQANLGMNGDDRTWAPLGVGWPTLDRVAMQAQPVVSTGALGTFTFRIRAPASPGVHAIHLRPVIDGTTWLEDYGVFLYVTVFP